MDDSSEAALISLTAFIGAVFGCTGCLAAAASADAALGLAAAGGTAVCATIWLRSIAAGVSTDM